MDDMLVLANQHLDRVRGLCTQLNLKYVDIAPRFLGVGIAVGFGPNDYVVLSIIAGAEVQLMATTGILKNVGPDRAAALEVVNEFNQNNTNFSVFLQSGDAGRVLLAQRTTPTEVYMRAPKFFEALVRGLPEYATEMRAKLAAETNLGGQPWEWTGQDLSDLLFRSFI